MSDYRIAAKVIALLSAICVLCLCGSDASAQWSQSDILYRNVTLSPMDDSAHAAITFTYGTDGAGYTASAATVSETVGALAQATVYTTFYWGGGGSAWPGLEVTTTCSGTAAATGGTSSAANVSATNQAGTRTAGINPGENELPFSDVLILFGTQEVSAQITAAATAAATGSSSASATAIISASFGSGG